MTKTQKPKTLTTKKRTPAFVKLSKSDKPEPPKKEIREKPTLQPIPIQVTASNETASRTTTNSPRNQEKPCIISKPPPIHVKSILAKSRRVCRQRGGLCIILFCQRQISSILQAWPSGTLLVIHLLWVLPPTSRFGGNAHQQHQGLDRSTGQLHCHEL
ncbi:unnamed protein product [Nezara viridula]|uniref:Uncharacterized protein n=1 Tax=Nezara viridula TaxID=85310 RepID=A0A9P0MQE4_NEZVI|nr:unnamed protein product [Nezara viridula]